MTSKLLFVLLASGAVIAVLVFRTLPWRSTSSDWPPVYPRIYSILLSALAVGYGLRGLLINDVWLPGKRGHSLHLHGWSAWSFFSATVCAALFFTSAMGDCVPGYRLQVFRRLMFVIGWFFFILSLIVWFVH